MAVDKNITIAIVGGGPGGLGTAIALSKLPFVTVKLYEQASESREIGAGISIGQNTWNVLRLLEAADGVKGASKSGTMQRNGHTGEVLELTQPDPNAKPFLYGPLRTRRARLQSALLAKVPAGIIEYNKKATLVEDLGEGNGVRLVFKDQKEITADLVIGADGIRSIVRRTIFPEHKLLPTGNTAWRVLIPHDSMRHLQDFPESTAWWHGKTGHFYFSHVDDPSERELCELTVRSYHETTDLERFATWAVPASNERVLSRCTDFSPKIKEVVGLVPEGSWNEFAMVAGPCLQKISGWGKIALIGDASHPLQGAFGSGAAFAMEDGWLLAQALQYTIKSAAPVEYALRIFEEIRSPYYDRMYKYLDERGATLKQARDLNLEFNDLIRARLAVFGATGGLDWIYKHDIEKTWLGYISA